VKKPKHRMLIFCQLYSLLKRQAEVSLPSTATKMRLYIFRRLSKLRPRKRSKGRMLVRSQ
jgi:hypothetical protein